MNLLLLESAEVKADGAVRLRDLRARHLLNVLRVKIEQTVRVGLLDGPLGVGRVTAIADQEVDLHCVFETDVPPLPRIDLLLALPRPKVLQRLWPQISALGVGQIILTNAERVERHYFDTHVLSPSVYRPLLIEGLQQARDTRLPAVSVHRRLRVLIEDELDRLAPKTRRLVASPSLAPPVRAAVHEARERILLAVGPEGGWNAFELALLERHRFTAVTLGDRILRSDTACVALLSVVHELLRDGPGGAGT